MDGKLHKVRVVHNETVDSVVEGPKRRALDMNAVERLAQSMSEIGLRTPITVRVGDDCNILVTGAHRLAAAKRLGWEWIECFHTDGDEIDARMEEIAENLHRAELSALERSEQIEEWRRLCEERKVRTLYAPSGGHQPKEKGQRSAARELGVSEGTVRNAAKVATLSDEAKRVAREVGLDDNQSALLDAAKETDAQGQVVRLQMRAAQKHADDPLNDFEARERQVAALMSAWNRASPEARQEFLHRVDRPVMDRAGWSSGTGANG